MRRSGIWWRSRLHGMFHGKVSHDDIGELTIRQVKEVHKELDRKRTEWNAHGEVPSEQVTALLVTAFHHKVRERRPVS